jgi:hypothetical protein
MKKMQIPILILSFLLICSTCKDDENCHDTIIFFNKSSDTLYVISSSEYPDTLAIRNSPDPTLNSNFTKVLPFEKNSTVLWGRDCVELAYKDLITSDTMMVYVFDAKVLETTSWDTVKANYLILKRYNLSLLDLKEMEWTITYP